MKFGIIGTGRIAHEMMRAFDAVPGADVIAVSSSDTARGEAFAAQYGMARAYDDNDALLADTEIEAVYVANHTHLHAPASIAALKAGKHVLCEKPFALNPEEGAAVIEAARASGKLFMEGLWTLLLPACQRVKEILGAKTHGEVLSLYSDFGFPASKNSAKRLYFPNGGGALLDRGVYPISFAIDTLGAVEAVEGVLQRNNDGVDLHVQARLRHANGVSSQIATSMIGVLSNRTDVACERGAVSLPSPVMAAERIQSYPAPESGAWAKRGGLKNKLKQTPVLRAAKSMVQRGEFHSYGANRYAPQISHFVETAGAGKTESEVVTHAHSMAVIETVNRIQAL